MKPCRLANKPQAFSSLKRARQGALKYVSFILYKERAHSKNAWNIVSSDVPVRLIFIFSLYVPYGNGTVHVCKTVICKLTGSTVQAVPIRLTIEACVVGCVPASH